MDTLTYNNDDTNFLISELISNGMDAGDKLMKSVEVALVDESNPRDKTTSPTPNE